MSLLLLSSPWPGQFKPWMVVLFTATKKGTELWNLLNRFWKNREAEQVSGRKWRQSGLALSWVGVGTNLPPLSSLLAIPWVAFLIKREGGEVIPAGVLASISLFRNNYERQTNLSALPYTPLTKLTEGLHTRSYHNYNQTSSTNSPQSKWH